jgi:hypothetical protein
MNASIENKREIDEPVKTHQKKKIDESVKIHQTKIEVDR